jgi:ATP citrate (pro-S)-lyase
LDLAAKLDETANFICSEKWKDRKGGNVDFPPPFGRDLTPEVCCYSNYFMQTLIFLLQEEYIAEMDAKTGASLKLTILNKNGRIWTMVAGGGASVIFTLVILAFL